jgi:alkylation response protein AidB-like acyl-CoA dehydrogenase
MRRSVYGDDHAAFRSTVREFLRREVIPHVEEHAREHGFGRDLWLAAGKQGLLGLEIPERFGGAEAGDWRFNAVLVEELAAVNLALASCLSIHFDVVAGYLTELGTPEQQERWLPGMASGENIGAIAMTEPSGGSDLAALRTSAVPEGTGWRLNGSKTFITNGFSADLVVVAARTTAGAGARGISLFVVETSREGFSRGRRLDKVGMPEADTAELVFEDVLVPDENRLGELDRGFKHMMVNLSAPRSPTWPTPARSWTRRWST